MNSNIVVEHDPMAWHCFGVEYIYSVIVNECAIIDEGLGDGGYKRKKISEQLIGKVTPIRKLIETHRSRDDDNGELSVGYFETEDELTVKQRQYFISCGNSIIDNMTEMLKESIKKLSFKEIFAMNPSIMVINHSEGRRLLRFSYTENNERKCREYYMAEYSTER